jgi:hypothetical protein
VPRLLDLVLQSVHQFANTNHLVGPRHRVPGRPHIAPREQALQRELRHRQLALGWRDLLQPAGEYVGRQARQLRRRGDLVERGCDDGVAIRARGEALRGGDESSAQIDQICAQDLGGEDPAPSLTPPASTTMPSYR